MRWTVRLRRKRCGNCIPYLYAALRTYNLLTLASIKTGCTSMAPLLSKSVSFRLGLDTSVSVLCPFCGCKFTAIHLQVWGF